MSMFDNKQQKQRTYTYTRGMRDGSTKTITAVVRSRTEKKRAKKVPVE